MNFITEQYGKPCYTLHSDSVSAYVAVEGGTLTADFHGEKDVWSPFFIAPWWKDAYSDEMPAIDRWLRGSFFCLPFGANAKPYNGFQFPVHGIPPNNNWKVLSFGEEKDAVTLILETEGEILGNQILTARQEVMLKVGQPVIYVSAAVSGINARLPVAFHPTLQLTSKVGGCNFDTSKPVSGFTPPVPVEVPEKQGYSLLKPGSVITDMHKVETVYGDFVDITACPFCRGFEDVAFFISDSERDFSFSAVTYFEENMLYFQLKNPKNLTSTMLWMSNGGRFYPPWKGRVFGGFGIEEANSFFHYGVKESAENNFLTERNFRTADDFFADRENIYKIIIGCVPVPEGFTGVTDIKRNGNNKIDIFGKKGECISLYCEVDYLSKEVTG